MFLIVNVCQGLYKDHIMQELCRLFKSKARWNAPSLITGGELQQTAASMPNLAYTC